MNRVIFKLAILVCLSSTVVLAQETPNRPSTQAEDVVKVNTELVQTDVAVFDKQGRFVKGLKQEDFELRIDGKPRPIRFFDSVTAGSASEENALAAARGNFSKSEPRSVLADRGRTIFFFIDDLHLDVSGFDQAKRFLSKFIERDLKQNDEAAIITASGRLGFLQQLTNNRAVLASA